MHDSKFSTTATRGLLVSFTLVAALVVSSPPAAASSPGAIAISAGQPHTCALMASGGVKCWGYNNEGELGDGTRTSSNTPVDVVDGSGGLLRGVAAISAGQAQTCALMATGRVECWGWNAYGQLGDGTTTDSSIPVDVVDGSGGLLRGVAAISAGGQHTCAVMTSGGVKCWGRNYLGELGDGTGLDSSIPVGVVDGSGGLLSEVAAISAGGQHTCAVMTSGGAKCWGWSGRGDLGDGTGLDSSIPVDVVDGSGGLLSGVAAISAGFDQTCALTTAGGVKCWGDNNYGQLGNGFAEWGRLTPVDVSNLTSGAAAVSAGYLATCAAMTSGGAQCWGTNLGDGTWTSSYSPVDVVDGSGGLLSGVAAISVAGNRGAHTCALMATGGVKCWGLNGNGELGDGTYVSSNVPVDVVGLTPPNTEPHLVLPANQTVEATSATGAAVTYSVSATDDEDSPPPTPICTPASGSVFPIGTTPVNCNVTDSGGLTDSGSFTVTVRDTTRPIIDAHADVTVTATSSSGAVVTYAIPATSDAVDGNKTATCSPASGTTFAIGNTTVTCDATDTAGNHAAPTTFVVHVVYNWTGFLSPVNNPPVVNTGKAGRTYPVKWQLRDAQGNYISALSAVTSVTYKSTTCGSFSNDPKDALETTATGSTSLRYDSTANQYVYNWATSGTGCYTLFVTLDDNTVHAAYFNFTK